MESKTECFMRRHMATFMAVVVFMSLLIVWELTPHFTRAGMFPPPASKIITKFINSLTVSIGRYTMPVHIDVSLYQVGVAFIIATLTGITLDVSIGYSETVKVTIEPIFKLIRPIPSLVWIPIPILWFGFGDQSRSFTILPGCFCFIVVDTYDETKNVDPMLLRAAGTLGASERQVFLRVALPSSVPYILAGLQIATIAGWSAVVGTGMVHSGEGVGWLTVMEMTNGNTVQIMVGILAIGIIEHILAIATAKLEGRLCIRN